MGNVAEFLRSLRNIFAMILRDGSADAAHAARAILRRLSIAARVAIIWPFVLLVVALSVGRYWPAQCHYVVLIATAAVLAVFLWLLTSWGPLGVLATEALISPNAPYIGKFIEKAREATNALRVVFVLELFAGIYFAWVPVANDPALAITQGLIVAAIVGLVGIKKWRPVFVGLVVAFILIAVVFFFYKESFSDQKGTVIRPIVINFDAGRQTDGQPQNTTPAAPVTTATPAAKKPASDAGIGQKGNGGDTKTATPPPPAPAPPDPKPLAPIYPLSENKGDIVPVMYDCYYRKGNVVTCEGELVNNDSSKNIGTGVYLMDSSGTVSDQYGRGTQFFVWTSNGSLQFSGGTDKVKVIPGMPSSFVFSFHENTGQAKTVGINLVIAPDPDDRDSTYEFVNVPVFDHRP